MCSSSTCTPHRPRSTRRRRRRHDGVATDVSRPRRLRGLADRCVVRKETVVNPLERLWHGDAEPPAWRTQAMEGIERAMDHLRERMALLAADEDGCLAETALMLSLKRGCRR